MSLEDHTNREIDLTIEGLTMTVDVDSDSSFDPRIWVDIDFYDREGRHPVDDESVSLTFEEAGKLHDRLGLILGRAQDSTVQNAFDQLHWGCNNDDHRQAYSELSIALGYRRVAPQ